MFRVAHPSVENGTRNSSVYPVPSVNKGCYGVSGNRKELTASAKARLERRVRWLQACKFTVQDNGKRKDFCVCSKHFVSCCFTGRISTIFCYFFLF